jgi:ketosteroid isomerase-like protein
MSEQERNLARVREAVRAFQRGDMDAMVGFLDPEVDVYASPQVAESGRFTGREGWLHWVSRWREVWETFEVELEWVEPVGEDHVLISVRQYGKGKGSGVPVEQSVCCMLEIRHGLATRYHVYPDRDQALEAAREGESTGPASP